LHLHEARVEIVRGAIVTPLTSSVIESCSLISCEVIGLDCVLLLMDTVKREVSG